MCQVEKVAFLRYYKKSNHYGIELPRVAVRLMPYAVLVNLLLCCWLLGDKQTLQSRVLSTGTQSSTSFGGVLQTTYNALIAGITFNRGGAVADGLRRVVVVPLVVVLLLLVSVLP